MALLVKTYPQLNAAALRGAEDRCLIVWYLARALDVAGSGAVRLDDLAEFVSPVMKRRTVQAHLRKGEGIFWERKHLSGQEWRHTVIKLRGLEALCRHFGVIPRSRPLIIPLEDFSGLARSRAALFSAWLQSRTARPTACETSEKVTAVKRGTQWHYKRNDPKRPKTYTVITRKNVATRRYQDGDQVGDAAWVKKNSKGDLYYFFRIPNSYIINLQTAARGRTRKVCKALSSRNKARDEYTRLYFRDPAKARKCKQRGAMWFAPLGISRGETDLWGAYAY